MSDSFAERMAERAEGALVVMEDVRTVATRRLEAAWRALAEVRTAQDAVAVTRGAEALRVFIKQARLGLRTQNEAAMLKIEACARAGEMLAASVSAGNPQLLDDPTIGRLPAGVSRFESHYWQRVAAVPRERRQGFYVLVGRNVDLAEVAAEGGPKPEPQEVTTAGTLRYHHMAVHRSSEEDEWLTPAAIVAATLDVLGTIDLDPCSNTFGAPNVPATARFTEADGGLGRTWRGRVYMNPPYGAAISAWTSKLRAEYDEGNVSEAVALVPARTDTDWWSDLRDSAVCLVHGRLRFSGAANSAPFPSAVAYFGERRDAFASAFAALGDIWVRLEA